MATTLIRALLSIGLLLGTGCAESTGADLQSVTIPGNPRQDAGDHDSGELPPADGCPRSSDAVPEVEPNDAAADAQRLEPCVVHALRGGSSDAADADHDWFEVVVPEGRTSLRVTVVSISGDGPELWLLKDADQPIEHRALMAGETLVATIGVERGEYLIHARSGAGSEYELYAELSNLAYELEESNDEALGAQAISFDTAYTGQDSALGAADETDWFVVDVPEGAGRLIVDVEDVGESDSIESEVWLLRAGAPPIEHRVLRGGEKVSITSGASEGEYFVRVKPGARRTYTLHVSLSDEPFELEEHNDVSETAQPLEIGERYEGGDSSSAADLDWDWFLVDVPAHSTSMIVRIKDIGTSGESGTAVWLYRPADRLIERRSLRAGQALDLHAGVTEGQYYIQVLVGKGRAYSLGVELTDLPFEIEESNDERETAPLIEPGTTYTGQGSTVATEPPDDDWFRVVVPDDVESIMVTFTDLEGADMGETELTVFDESAIQIGYLTSAAGETESATFRIGGPGEHALIVRTAHRRQYRFAVMF